MQLPFRKIAWWMLVSVASIALPASDSKAPSSPDERQITDPTSVVSAANPAATPAPIPQLYYTRSTLGPAWSPDGREVVFTTNMTGRLNLWKVSASGGWPIQLTQSDDFQSNAVWSPDGKWIVFEQDFGGGQISDLFAVPSGGGEVINATNTPDIAENNPRWSPDGSMLAMNFRPKAAPIMDIAVLDWKTRTVRNLTNEQDSHHQWFKTIWSADAKFIYSDRDNPDGTDSDVYRITVATGQLENLTPHQGSIFYSVWSVSPDGRTLLISSNQKGGYQNIALLDIASKKQTWVTDVKWEARRAEFAPDGKSFTYVVNADGRTAIYRVDRQSGQTEKLAFPEGMNFSVGNPTSYSPSGDRMLISHQSSTQPGDLWVYDFATHKSRQLTFSAIASLNPSRLPVSQLVHYKTFDGKTISAFLWMPFNLKRDGGNPAVVLPHGGPTGQTFDSFDKTGSRACVAWLRLHCA